MEVTLNSKTSYHARSNSLPTRSHPVSEQFDEQLSRLRSSASASTSSSLSQKLNSLKDLYNSVDELLLLPLNQQILAQERQAKWVDNLLDGSLRLLDICGIVKDVLVQSKERVQDIQSVLRRKCSGELSIANEANEYINTRKTAKKAIKKCVKDVSSLLNKSISKDDGSSALFSALRALETTTVEIFQMLLSYMAGPNKESSNKSLFAILKLQHNKVASEKEEASPSEFEDVDAALSSAINKKNKSSFNIYHAEKLHDQMINLESVIQDFDEALESLFRRQVKTRATILNILSN